MRAVARLFPGDPPRDPAVIEQDIRDDARDYARVCGHGPTAQLLAGLAHEHHLRSVPRGTRPKRRART